MNVSASPTPGHAGVSPVEAPILPDIVLLLDRCEVVSVDYGADVATKTGVRQRFYRHPPPRGTVSLSELAR